MNVFFESSFVPAPFIFFVSDDDGEEYSERNSFFFVTALISCGLIFNSCKKTEEVAPVVVISADVPTRWAAMTLKIAEKLCLFRPNVEQLHLPIK